MADETIKKVLDFDVKLNDADAKILATARAIEEVEHELDVFNATRKMNIKLTDEQIIKENELKVKLSANKEELRALTNIQKLKTQATKSEIGSIDQLNKLYKAAKAELDRLGGTIKRNKDGTLELTNVNQKNAAQVLEQFNLLKQYDATLNIHNRNVGNYSEAIRESTGVLAGLKNQIAQLQNQRSVATDPDEVLRLTGEIRKLTLQYDQYTGVVDEFGNRIAKNDIKEGFNDASDAAFALTGSLSLLTFAFGDESETGKKLEQTLRLIGIAQLALTVAQKAGKASSVAGLIVTKAQTVAQRGYTVAVGQSTGALKLFRLAVAGTGIGLLILGLIEAAKAMHLFGKSIEDTAAEQQELIDKAIDKDRRRIESIKNTSEESNKLFERELQQDELSGASDLQLTNKRIKHLEDLKEKETEVFNKSSNDAALNTLAKKNIFDIEGQLNELYSERKKIYADLHNAEQKRLEDAFEAAKSQLVTQEIETQNNLNFTNSEADELNALLKVLGFNINVEDIPDLIQKLGEDVLAPAKEQLKPYQISILPEDEQMIQDMENFKNSAVSFSEDLGKIFASSLTETGLDLEKFFKGVTTLILDTLEKTFIATQVEILAKDIATLGFAGIATAAAKIALITAAFESAKALLNRQPEAFYEGGEVDVEGNKNIKDGTVWQNQYGQKIKTHAGEKMFVLNPAASDEYRKLAWLSSFNQYFGGRGLRGTHTALYDGGIANTSVMNRMNSGIDYAKLAEALSKNGAPTLVFKDFDIAYGKYKSSEGLVSLG